MLTVWRSCVKAELAPQLGVTRTHVTLVLSLLLLAPESRDAIAGLGDPMEGTG